MDKINLWMPLIKSMDSSTGYLAILSDTSIDRDKEMMSKELLIDLSKIDFLPGFLDHDTKVLNKVCQWINKRVIEINGNSALVAEPKFFKSNPKAIQLMGQLDEGDVIGVSISGMPLKSEEVNIAGEIFTKYTKLEGLEASFCGIQSNRNALAMRIAKSFNFNIEKNSDIKKNKKEVDEEMNDEEKIKLEKEMKEKDDLIKSLTDNQAEMDKKLAELTKSNAEAVSKKEAELKEKEASIEVMKKELNSPLYKKSLESIKDKDVDTSKLTMKSFLMNKLGVDEE
jgi:hypothetical protein